MRCFSKEEWVLISILRLACSMASRSTACSHHAYLDASCSSIEVVVESSKGIVNHLQTHLLEAQSSERSASIVKRHCHVLNDEVKPAARFCCYHLKPSACSKEDVLH